MSSSALHTGQKARTDLRLITDPQKAQLLAIASDPTSSEDNREGTEHDLSLEFPSNYKTN
jgi:hypothetical protein